ncbi:MAG: glutathione peroxidase [Gammaproteobacteria bacterium]|jgi:glutathione peroxidase|nr:glutathione peroxidase [Gammaproteobacteria bacterium]
MRIAAVLLLAAPSVWGCPPTLDFTLRPLGSNEPERLCDRHAGKVVLIVNTASKCGFTPQFEGLEALHARYHARGFAVLGMPSNDFGAQDPGTEAQIQDFCRLTYGVQFPMYEKTRAAQPAASPLYRALGELAGEYPRWNFHKYLLDRQGRLVGSFPSAVEPDDPRLVRAIEEVL